MFTSIAQVEAMLSEEMAHRLTWGQFVNWNGGQGMNIACDMAQEICNRVSKDVVKGMGANKTTKAMVRASRAAAGVKQIVQAMDKASDIKKMSTKHSHKKSIEDELLMLQDLRKLKPFAIISGRHHNHFPDIALSPTSTINMSNFFTWLQKHKKQISMGFKR